MGKCYFHMIQSCSQKFMNINLLFVLANTSEDFSHGALKPWNLTENNLFGIQEIRASFISKNQQGFYLGFTSTIIQIWGLEKGLGHITGFLMECITRLL